MAQKDLIPVTQRTKEEQKKIRRAGGIASGKARRRKRDLREALKALLDAELKGGQNGTERIALAWFTKAANGDLNAIKMVLETLYPKEQKIDLTSSDGSMTPPKEIILKLVKPNGQADSGNS